MIKHLSFVIRCSAFIKDDPGKVNLALCVIVLLHWLLDALPDFPHIWHGLIEASVDQQSSIFLAILSVSAMVAGFAGVVVVFGLSTVDILRKLRASAGKALTRNWISVSNAGFLGTGLALIAVLVLYSPLKHAAVWFFELAILICLNGILRLLWLLKSLIKLVQADDIKKEQEEDEIK